MNNIQTFLQEFKHPFSQARRHTESTSTAPTEVAALPSRRLPMTRRRITDITQNPISASTLQLSQPQPATDNRPSSVLSIRQARDTPPTMSYQSPVDGHNVDFSRVKTPSTSPEPADGQPGGKHRRNYQACDRCRQRKVKCDLGPVDNPHEPPCARCRRERVPCEFAKQRKKEKGASEERDVDSNPAKRQRRDTGESASILTYDNPVVGYGGPHSARRSPAIDPSLGAMRDPNLAGMRPPMSIPNQNSLPNQNFLPNHTSPNAINNRPSQSANRLAGNMQAYDTVIQQDLKSEYQSSAARALHTDNPPQTTTDSINTLIEASEKLLNVGQDPQTSKKIARSFAGGSNSMPEQRILPEVATARAEYAFVWKSARLVRAGWFTVDEAYQYVEYFYTNLQPMTPVDVSQFRHPSKHLSLLTEEPVLALTILMISSRYMKLSGRSSGTRAHKIHEQLWTSLMEFVQRLFWGQEQFGGGFTGAGVSKVRESASGQITWPGGLRTLGTIEALLLLSDWQPRSLHFPPADDDNHLLSLNYDDLPNLNKSNGTGAHNPSLDALPYASFLEPAWRSDKMCWTLMGLAQVLSSELGIFESEHARPMNAQMANEQLRKLRIHRMVQVYVAQISGRNGIPTPLVLPDWNSVFQQGVKSSVDHIQGLFLHIASIMFRANRDIFRSRQFTRNLTSGDQFRKSIEAFVPLLREWMQHFEEVKTNIPEPMRSILLMEYEYARLYINSLGMQNVVGVWMRTDPQHQNSNSTVTKVAQENKRFINEVTAACVHILELVSTVLGNGGHLRDAPVRVFLRCLSAMMFTLKRLSLGQHERMVRKLLGLLDDVCLLLARDVVDDVHLCAQTSALIQSIVRHVRNTMIRVAHPANTSGAPSADQSRAQTPHHAGLNEAGQQAQGLNNYASSALPTYTNDPLANIPARPIADFMDHNNFIAPPNYNFQTNDFDNFMDNASLDESTMSDNPTDWLTLPLDGLMGQGEGNVDQGFHSIGPMVGSRDMMEVLTNQDYNVMRDFGGNPWTSPTAQYHHPQQGYTSPHL